MKGKGGKERYIQLSVEFQRIARKDKRAFLSEQCKQTEENSRMGKKRDLFKKVGDTKGAFHARMGTIKDRKAMEQKQKILRRSDKSTQKNYTKKIMTQITRMV